MRVLITGAYRWNDERINKIKAFGHEVDFVQNEWDKVENPEEYEIVICNNLFRHNSPESFKKLKMIQLVSSAVSDDLSSYANENKIALYNAKGVYSIPIAECIIMQILNICKNNKGLIKNQEQHLWEKDRTLIELTGKRALIVGFGGIGCEVAKRLKAFGVHVTAANRTQKKDFCVDEWIDIQSLKSRAQDFDIVIVTIALCGDTVNLIDRAFLENMKDSSAFLNFSRGDIVDEDALIELLKLGKFRGAALDVMHNEPNINDELWDIEKLYVTPHNSFVSENTDDRLFEIIYNNLKNFSN